MFVLVNKPTGYTSFDVVKKLKRLYPGEKIGHAGTLDPLATGLLIIAIGKDTKKISKFVGLDKTYVATIDFLQDSDTRDTDYWKRHTTLEYDEVRGVRRISEESEDATNKKGLITNNFVPIPTLQEIKEKLDSIVGYHPLPLTPFSAKKWKGKKLYEYAREGNPVFIDIDMQLISYEIISYNFPVLQVRLQVGSGTYIRSMAHRLGEQFGLGGILTSLHREKVGEYGL